MRNALVSGLIILGALSSARAARSDALSAAPSTAAAVPASSVAAPASTAPAISRPGADRPSAGVAMPGTTPRRSLALRFTLSPEWGYRSFRDREPSSTDKQYVASGVPMASARLELYPLAFVDPAPDVAKDFGITVSYSRAFWLSTHDIDTDTDVDTQWYQFGFGARYRILGGTSPLALGFTLGIQRWVFDFGTTPPSRPIAIGRYTLLPVGVDARYALGALSLFADGRFLLPLTVSPFGDRTPSGGRFGFNAALGAAMTFSRFFEVEVRAAYTLLSVSLPAVGGRVDQRGSVADAYLVLGAGATVLY